MASTQSDIDWQSTKKTVLERNRHMFSNPDISDISFTCEGSEKTFYAHKYVLATSSCVFHAMFYGVLAERDSIVKLDDTDEKSLEEFLRFLYRDECTLTSDNVASVLYLAKKYMVACLTEKCVAELRKEMNDENVLNILEQAVYFDLKELEAECWNFIEQHTSDMVSSESFDNISQKTLLSVLNRDKLNIPEIELFQAVLKWSETQCMQQNLSPTAENKRSVMGDAIYAIKFLSMSQQEFAQHVSKSGLFTIEERVAMYDKLNGVHSEGLKWTLSKREPPLPTVKVTHKKVRFRRFDSRRHGSWKYDNWEPDRLCFSVSKDAIFHGICLLGDGKGSLYNVILEVKGAKVSGKFRDVGGALGFDVMLESPIVIEANEVVILAAIIKGPASYMGNTIKGKTTVEKEGVTVTFSDAPSPNHGTNTSRGQFFEIILSV